MPVMMGFGSCCGANIIQGFYGSVKDTETYLRLSLKTTTCLTFVILTSYEKQNAKYSPLLLRLGLRRVSGPVRNPNSGCSLYTYVYEKKRMR